MISQVQRSAACGVRSFGAVQNEGLLEQADKGYDYPRCRRYLHRRGIKVRIARRGVEDKTRLGRHRWVVERTEGTLRPLLLLAVSIINLRRLVSITDPETRS